MVFGGKPSVQLMLEVQKAKEEKLALETKQKEEEPEESKTIGEKFKGFFQELVHLYGPLTLRKRALIAHFTWCVTSLSYYVLALNGENLKANIYLYVAMTGSVDILGYIISMIILRYMGRRLSSAMLFTLAGVSMLVVLGIPKSSIFVVCFAMLSRFSITSVYAIMTLHTAELFPTEIRNTALGISSTAAHVGSIFAPFIVDILGLVGWYIPTTICGITVLAAGLFTLLQPETKGRHLTDHVNQETAHQDIELSNHKE
jgi:predicted MFS family arabinose efflux permease